MSYRRSPEHRYPCAYNDGWAALKWVKSRPWLQSGKDMNVQVVILLTMLLQGLLQPMLKYWFAAPGGLIGVGTSMDPALSRSDVLVGQVLGDVGTLPEVYIELKIKRIRLLRQLIGVEKKDSQKQQVSNLVKSEVIMLNILSMATGAQVIRARNNSGTLQLTAPVCTGIGVKVVLSRKVGGHWRVSLDGVR